MTPYLLLMFLPSLFALFNTQRLSLLLWYFTFAVFVAFVGLRYEVGPDWLQYGYIHRSLAYLSFGDVLAQAEPLSYLLFWLSEISGYHVTLSNFFAALLLMTGVFAFARRTSNPWLAVVAATPYLIIVMGMSGVRQTMAAGIVLFLFSRWERTPLIARVFYLMAAALFHTSALVNNVFLVIKLNIALRYKLMLGTLVLFATLYLGFEVSMYSDNMLRYQERYIEGAFVNQSFGSLYHIALIAIPAVIGFIYKKRISDQVHSESLLRFGLYAAVATLAIDIFSSTAASRLTVYLYFVPMMVYPALVSTFGRRMQLGSVFAVVAVHMLILVGWFDLANVAFAYMPYQNLLFHD